MNINQYLKLGPKLTHATFVDILKMNSKIVRPLPFFYFKKYLFIFSMTLQNLINLKLMKKHILAIKLAKHQKELLSKCKYKQSFKFPT